EPIKFRCTRCGRLLGVARARAGAVVSCPKCSATLVVPPQTEPAARAPAPGPPRSTTGTESWPEAPGVDAPGSLDSGSPLEVLDPRPEDIRVEPGVRDQSLNISPPVGPEPPPDETEAPTEPDDDGGVLPIRVGPDPDSRPEPAPGRTPPTPPPLPRT